MKETMKKEEARSVPTLFWSRLPGKFVHKTTGDKLLIPGLEFSGTVREWYETLVETIIDCHNELLRKRLGARSSSKNKKTTVYVHPNACLILESSVLFKPCTENVVVKGRRLIGQVAFINVWKDANVKPNAINVLLTPNDRLNRGVVVLLDMPYSK